MKLTVGEAIVKFLDNQYVSFDGKETKFVENFYAIFGHGCVVGVGEALSMTKHGLTVYQGKNEQGMAHAAIAYAKQNNRRKIIPCMSSIGPGAANMVTTAALATVNNIPLLLFCGDTFSTRQPDPVLQQLEQPYDAGITTNDAFKPVTRYFDRITRPEVTMTALINAMRVLTDPALTGAVCIACPQDVQGQLFDFPEEFFKKRVHRIIRMLPVKEELDDAVLAILAAKKPLVIVGGGVRYSEAGAAIENFCKKFNVPFAETQAGKSAIKSSSPYNLGGIGVTGNSAANKVAMDCDLVIGIGTRFTDFTTASKSLFAGKRVVAINVSTMHAGKLDAIRVLGDAKETVQKLTATLSAAGYKSGYKDEYALAKKEWDDEMARLTSIEVKDGYVPENTAMNKNVIEDFIKANGSALAQTTALGIVRKYIPKNAVAISASGSLPGCMQRMWTTDELYSYNMEYGYSCMGYEVSGAFGCKLAHPDKEVYAFVGDGGFLMLHSELITAVQENKKITVLLFDNGGFGCINNLQMGQGIDSLATEFRKRDDNNRIQNGEFIKIDFAKVAEGYGCVSYTAKTEAELISALKKAAKQTRPVLIDIKVLPKSMTHGYDGGWWNVGINEQPRNQAEQAALDNKMQNIAKARKY